MAMFVPLYRKLAELNPTRFSNEIYCPEGHTNITFLLPQPFEIDQLFIINHIFTRTVELLLPAAADYRDVSHDKCRFGRPDAMHPA
jgi:hypothetical protein